jgi:peptide/nickel transport system ATP-binding protein
MIAHAPAQAGTRVSLLSARGLVREYTRSGAWLGRPPALRALDGVDLDIAAGESLAIVGRSGSGKSTLARCLARFEKPDAGHVYLDGQDVTAIEGRALLPLRRVVQLIVQEPGRSLCPRWDAAEIVAEPLRLLGGLPRDVARTRSKDFLAEVGLDPDLADRRPGQLSGGQRQRLGLARALAARPRLLILDESLSGLDPSIAAQMIELLLGLRQALGLGLLLITHDLDLAACVAERVAVMERGVVVEEGPVGDLLVAPAHPFTRALVAASASLPRLSAAALSS